MHYLTDRKRARGLGATGTGTANHWFMTVSAVALIILLPTFVFIFGPLLGAPYEVVVARLSHPFPAIVIALTVIVALLHFKNGVRSVIEDYVHGPMREVLIIATVLLSYAAAATGLFALARIAL